MEATLKDPTDSARWIADHWDELPLPPATRKSDVSELGAMLSSFFRTSFEIRRIEWNGKVTHAELNGTGKTLIEQTVGRRQRHGGNPFAECLQHVAIDGGQRPPREVFDRLAK